MTASTAVERDHPPLPWPVGELVRLYALNAGALVALIFAWWYAAGTVRGGHQIGAVAVGIGAVIVSGCANTLWLLVGRRSVAARRVALRSSLEDLAVTLQATGDAVDVRRDANTSTAAAYVTVDRGTRYHRANCELVVGKTTTAWSPADAGADWRTPCGVCNP
jgi:hypothetical protein